MNTAVRWLRSKMQDSKEDWLNLNKVAPHQDTKHVLRLSVILHVLFHAIDKALGRIPPASTLSLRISKEDVQRAIAINEYSVDVKAILKEVKILVLFMCLIGHVIPKKMPSNNFSFKFQTQTFWHID